MLYFADVDISLNGFSVYLVFIILIGIFLSLIFILLTPVLLFSAALRKQAERFRQQRDSTVIAQYEPPYGLSPAEIGLLYDMKCENKEIRATLFLLQQRKIITMDSMSAVSVINPDAYNKLEEYEKVAVRMFAKEASTLEPAKTFPITIASEKGTQTFNLPVPPAKSKYHFTTAVQQSLATKGYKTKNYTTTFVARVLIASALFGLWPMVSAALPLDSNGVTYAAWSIQSFGSAVLFTILIGIFAFPLYLLFGYLFMRLYVRIAGRAWLNTKQIRRLWPELEGYRLFLEQVDLDNIQFESVQGSPVTATLPYAMVFNLDTKWQHRLK